MKIMNIKLRKSSKFLILLLASLLIGIANSAVFYSMVAQPTISVTAAKVVFVPGNDFPTGSSLETNSTWVSLALKAYPNITLTYEQPLNITNTDTAVHTFRLRHVSISPGNGSETVGNFTFIKFVVQNTNGVAQNSFNYTTSGVNWITPATTSYMTLAPSTTWIIYAETAAAAGANDVATVSIQISVDVV